MQKNTTIVRKLPLPLEISFNSEPTLTDGLFSLSGKEASKIRIIDIDPNDKYATIEIYPPSREKTQERGLDVFVLDSPIGTELSKSRGLGKQLGQYKYFKRTNGSIYAIIESAGGRVRKLQIGNLQDRSSPISIIARTIRQSLTTEFSKSELMKKLQKPLNNGQIIKATLDILTLEGYLEKTQSKSSGRGRLGERFKATENMSSIIVTPEQA